MTIPEGYGQATFEFTGAVLPTGAATTVGFENVADASASAIAFTMGALFEGTLLEGLVDDVTLVNTHIKLGPDDTGPTADQPSSTAGSGIDPPASPQVSYLVRKVTALGGRANRGRMYLPGVSEDAVQGDGDVDPAALADQQDRADAFFDGADTAGHPLVVLHDGAGTPTPITSLAFDSRVATQRRRLRR